MRKYFSALLLLMAIASTSFAQINSNDLIPYRKGDKTGYCDINGKVIIKLKYDEAMPFSEGLAPVRIKQWWGYIDSTGRQVVPLEFDFVGKFKNGLAEAGDKRGLAGVIDRKGKFVIQPKYRSVDAVPGECQLAEDTSGIATLFDNNGKLLLANFDARYNIHFNRYLHFKQKVKNRIDRVLADSLLKLEEFTEDEKKELKEGYQMLELHGLYDLEQKKFILNPVYVDFELVADTKGMSAEKSMELGKSVRADSSIPGEQTKRLYFLVESLNGKGMFSFSGKEIVPAVYTDLDESDFFYNEVIAVQNKNGYHLIDRNGKVLTGKYYELIKGLTSKDMLFEYKMNGKSGLLTLDGKELTPPVFKDVDVEGAAAICEYDSTAVYIHNQNSFKTAKSYQGIKDVDHDGKLELMEIRLNDKVGMMDSTGKEIVPPLFDKIKKTNDYLVGTLGKSQRVFDFSGNELKLNPSSKFICGADKNKKTFLVHRSEGIGYESAGKFTLLKKAKLSDDVFCVKQKFGDTTYSWISVNDGSGLLMSTSDGAKILVPFNYYADPYNKERIVLSDTTKQVSGVYTLSGKEVVPINYYSCEDGRSTYDYDFADFIIGSDKIGCAVYNGDGKIIYKNPHGIASFEVLNEAEETEDMVTGVRVNSQYKVFDAKTKNFRPYTLSNFEFGETYRFVLLHDSLGNWAVGDQYFAPVTTFRYKLLKHLMYDERSDNYILLYQNDDGKFGLIDEKGKELTPAVYDAVEGSFTDALALVKQEEKYGLIDLSGKIIVPVSFTNAMDQVYDDVFSAVDAAGFIALYDENGNCLLKPGLFKQVNLIARGRIAGRNFICVEVAENDTEIRCFIDETGKVWYDK